MFLLTKAGLKAVLVCELPRLRRFAHSLTGNKPDADDLVQSMVEKLLTKQPQTTPEVPWLLRVCKNLWIDQIRTNKNREQLLEQNNQQQPEAVENGPHNDTMDEIFAAMAQLNDEQKQLVGLVIVEGFSYAEAAQVLEIPVGTVMSRVARARAKLAQILDQQT
jgi:RNA polymerase sigma-70 factor (ECF subfamily)